MERIVESLKPVLEQAKHVRINLGNIKKFVDDFDCCNLESWLCAAPVDYNIMNDEEKAAFLFVFNAISFSYWGDPKWRIDETNNRGTFDMITAIQRARKEGIPILDSAYLADIENLGDILNGDVTIPLLQERTEILREIGFGISSRYGKSFLKFVSIHGDAEKIVCGIINEFPSFHDSSLYKGKEVLFHKRAQLLVSDLHQIFGLGKCDKLTACADYIIPMVMRYYGILEYSPSLALKVDNRVEIRKGSEEEIEIRASTLGAIELIKGMLKSDISSMQLNDYFWLAGDAVPEGQNYHLTRTTAY